MLNIFSELGTCEDYYLTMVLATFNFDAFGFTFKFLPKWILITWRKWSLYLGVVEVYTTKVSHGLFWLKTQENVMYTECRKSLTWQPLFEVSLFTFILFLHFSVLIVIIKMFITVITSYEANRLVILEAVFKTCIF